MYIALVVRKDNEDIIDGAVNFLHKTYSIFYLLELSEQLISDHSPEDGSEVAEEGEGVVDDCGRVLGKVKLVLDVNRKNGWNKECLNFKERAV